MDAVHKPARDLSLNVPIVGVVAPDLEILGGQGVQAASLMAALRRDGFEVVFIPINPGFPLLLRWVRKIPFVRTVLNQILYLFSLRRIREVDVVHLFSASYFSFILGQIPCIVAATLFGKRLVLNYHSGEADDHLANWGIMVHPWLRRVSEIVVPSVYLQKIFLKHGYQSRVVRNIVSLEGFSFRRRTELKPRLLSVRNLEKIYRIDNILRAFSIVRQTFPSATLTVAGYGSQENVLKEQVRCNSMEGVEFVGRVEPAFMSALYDSADIFINASEVDNQPVSILEAFASGLPVVSTAPGDITAMVIGQKTGLIVAGEPAAIARGVLDLLAAPQLALAMADAAREEVEKYTWPYVKNAWQLVFNGKSA